MEKGNQAVNTWHTRKLELPNGKGWIEIRGQFNPFDLSEKQRTLIDLMAEWFREFEKTCIVSALPTPADPPQAGGDNKEKET